MTDWAQVVVVSVPALLAATAALLGAWLQGKLSRRAAAEAYDRQIVQDHSSAVRIAVSGLLGKIDIAAQGASQLIDPQVHISREVARQTNLSIPRARGTIQGQIDLTWTAFSDILSEANIVHILRPALLSDSIINEIRTLILQLNRVIIFNLQEDDKGNIRGGMKLEHVNQLYQLHSKITEIHNSWAKGPELAAQEQNAVTTSKAIPGTSA